MQISLVWNARDEDSVQSEKLHKMTEVIQHSNHGLQCLSHNITVLSPILLCILSVLQVLPSSQKCLYLIIVPFSVAVEEG